MAAGQLNLKPRGQRQLDSSGRQVVRTGASNCCCGVATTCTGDYTSCASGLQLQASGFQFADPNNFVTGGETDVVKTAGVCTGLGTEAVYGCPSDCTNPAINDCFGQAHGPDDSCPGSVQCPACEIETAGICCAEISGVAYWVAFIAFTQYVTSGSPDFLCCEPTTIYWCAWTPKADGEDCPPEGDYTMTHPGGGGECAFSIPAFGGFYTPFDCGIITVTS
jgi:hypothetical protein